MHLAQALGAAARARRPRPPMRARHVSERRSQSGALGHPAARGSLRVSSAPISSRLDAHPPGEDDERHRGRDDRPLQVAPRRPAGVPLGGDQPALLVVAQRGGRDAAALGQLPDGQRSAPSPHLSTRAALTSSTCWRRREPATLAVMSARVLGIALALVRRPACSPHWRCASEATAAGGRRCRRGPHQPAATAPAPAASGPDAATRPGSRRRGRPLLRRLSRRPRRDGARPPLRRRRAAGPRRAPRQLACGWDHPAPPGSPPPPR